MNVIPFKPPASPLPKDFPALLRAIADQVESGACTAFVGIACIDEEYVTLEPSSLCDSLMLAALLQHGVAEKFIR